MKTTKLDPSVARKTWLISSSAGTWLGKGRSSHALSGLLAILLFQAPTLRAQSPSIKSGGVQSAGAFGGFPAVAPGSWIEIYGSNLAEDARSWTGADFTGNTAPTSLDGTSVTIGGQAAFIDYISSAQVNAQIPSTVPSGLQSVIIKTAQGASSPVSVTVNAAQPGLLAPPSFNIGGEQYVTALFPDGTTYVLPPGAIAEVTSRRAQPGDTITLYGIGFGTVAPNTPAGQIVSGNNSLALPLTVSFGQTQALVPYDGLAPGAIGLYQFNVVVPSVPPSDLTPLSFSLNGIPGSQTLYVAVQSGAAMVQSLSLSPGTVSGGGSAQGTVTLTAAAPAGGAVVALSSSTSIVMVPATVTVPAGSTSASFTVTTSNPAANQSATITASYAGASAQATLTVTPASTGQPLPHFSSIDGFVTQTSSSTVGMAIYQILLASENGVNSGTVSGSVFASLADPNPPMVGLGFSASSLDVIQNGATFTFGSINPGGSTMSYKGSVVQITAASFTLTLTPQTVATSGTMSGSFSATSTIGTVSGTFTGTYTAEE